MKKETSIVKSLPLEKIDVDIRPGRRPRKATTEEIQNQAVILDTSSS
jgi:hypothetical protein